MSAVSCRQQQAPIVAVEYKRDFPVDTAITLQEIPMEMPTVPALPCRLGNRLVVLGSYQTAYLYTYPDLRLVRSCQLPPFASHSVMGDELYLESQGKVDVYRLDHSDSLVLTRSLRVATVPYSTGGIQPLGKTLTSLPAGSTLTGPTNTILLIRKQANGHREEPFLNLLRHASND